MEKAPTTPEEARDEVMRCEHEIQSIKGALRRLGSSTSDGEPNSLEIVFLKVEGLPEQAQPKLTFQLSSPVEEGSLTALFDPLNCDPPPEGSECVFRGVETSVATLTVTVWDAEIDLGSSAPREVAPICALDDAMNMKDKYVTEITLPIIAAGGEGNTTSTTTTAAAGEATVESEEEKGQQHEEEEQPKPEVAAEAEEVKEPSNDEQNDDEAPSKVSDAVEESKVVEAHVVDIQNETDEAKPDDAAVEATAEPVLLMPVCTVTLRFTYKPSQKDQREELYELLNKTSQQKATALEHLRELSLAKVVASRPASSTSDPSAGSAMSSSASASVSSGGGGVLTKGTSGPAVKAGFLNKKKKEPTQMQTIYERTIGPNSVFMRSMGVLFMAKNYIIFFGSVAFFHFRGHTLALPAPV